MCTVSLSRGGESGRCKGQLRGGVIILRRIQDVRVPIKLPAGARAEPELMNQAKLMSRVFVETLIQTNTLRQKKSLKPI